MKICYCSWPPNWLHDPLGVRPTNTTTTIIFPKSFASDVASNRRLMTHQMKDHCVFSVFHCVEGGIWCVIQEYPKIERWGSAGWAQIWLWLCLGRPLEKGTQTQTFWSGYFQVGWGSSTWRGGGQKVRYGLRNPGKPNRETLCESGRWVDALKKRGRVLKKRGRVLKKKGRFLRRGV